MRGVLHKRSENCPGTYYILILYAVYFPCFLVQAGLRFALTTVNKRALTYSRRKIRPPPLREWGQRKPDMLETTYVCITNVSLVNNKSDFVWQIPACRIMLSTI